MYKLAFLRRKNQVLFMAQNLAVSNLNLKDFLLSEEEITKKVETREHIFEIKNSDEVLGFISLYDLKPYSFSLGDGPNDLQVRSIDSSEWMNLFEHPFFQRRKPQLISAQTLKEDDDQEFFILKKGQKCGPYEKYELSTMVEEKELLLTDMVSHNGGHTWMKVYQVEGFDRRTLKDSDALPGLPDEDFLKREAKETQAINLETDALTSLAYLGNLKRGKSFEREKNENLNNEIQKKVGSGGIYKWLLIASILGIAFFGYHIKNQLTSPFSSKEENSVGEQAEMLTPVEGPANENAAIIRPSSENSYNSQVMNDQRRMGKFETRKLDPIRPSQKKSFMETGKYQKIKSTRFDNNDATDDANFYYDNNTAPVELDPVRAQVSKETYQGTVEDPNTSIPASDTLFEQEVSN